MNKKKLNYLRLFSGVLGFMVALTVLLLFLFLEDRLSVKSLITGSYIGLTSLINAVYLFNSIEEKGSED